MSIMLEIKSTSLIFWQTNLGGWNIVKKESHPFKNELASLSDYNFIKTMSYVQIVALLKDFVQSLIFFENI